MGKVYGADLVGAGLGAAAILVGLYVVTPETALKAVAVLAFAACVVATPALADGDAHTERDYRDVTPIVGGLSLVPERWRYRPAPTPAAIVDAGQRSPADIAGSTALLANNGLRTLEAAYVADRQSFINTLRSRRGLSFLTLWEGAGRCLFLGVNERGRAGLNFVRVRQADRDGESRGTTLALYDELTGKPRATYPEPPRLFPH